MQPKHNRNLIPAARELRKAMTKEERHLWYDFLRGYPVRFTRQKILGKFIADFYCASAKIVIEVDGSQHLEESGKLGDAERTAFLQEYGLRVLRVPNHAVNLHFDRVCHYIDAEVKRALSKP